MCVESVTAVIDGPLAFAAFYTFVRQSPHRYLIQLIVSLCQLYGDVLYFLTEASQHAPNKPVWLL